MPVKKTSSPPGSSAVRDRVVVLDLTEPLPDEWAKATFDVATNGRDRRIAVPPNAGSAAELAVPRCRYGEPAVSAA
jgi:hypothetical protein